MKAGGSAYHANIKVVTPTLGGCRIIRPHPSAPPDTTTGYVVADVVYGMIDGKPDEETLRYAREFAAAPRAFELLERLVAESAISNIRLAHLARALLAEVEKP